MGIIFGALAIFVAIMLALWPAQTKAFLKLVFCCRR